ncbi:VanZ family protein [Clostridium sp. CCUG 7971]|uniref:VanZ family protein n=1 Tax=Clostridium sp. CCUG 7971 TaxID=2811414 RepID=UPI001ABB839A|nr:VanZ family protein [Clostridium sp. CCUG 7971]MBO3444961.1 VanZ family protein [Clostridium sp. CCUG 7971]
MINASFSIVMILTIIAWGIYRLVLYKRNKKINILRECVLLLFLLYFLVLLLVTVFKYSAISFSNPLDKYVYNKYGVFGIINLIPFKETISTLTDNHVPIMMPIRNIVGNILLFIPLGLMIPILFEKYNKLSKIFFLGFISSLSIEVVQLFVGDNVSDIDDVIFNTTGAILGLLCYKLLKKVVKKTKLNNTLESINDSYTENIFNKSIKVLSMISILIVSVYTYYVYDQTGSDKLSNQELAMEIFKDNSGKFIDSKDLEDKKFYLFKNEDGLATQALVKYGKSRYANSYESYGYYIGNDVGYTIDFMSKLEPSTDKITYSVIVYGKNSNASKLVITLDKKDYKIDLKTNDYFLAVYPEYLEIDEDIISNIHNGVNSEDFTIKFLDSNGNIVKDMKFKKE